MDIRSIRLREAIGESSYNQSEICEKLNINKGSMSSYLSGRYHPKQNNIFKLAELLGVSEGWLMGYDIPKRPGNKYADGGDIKPAPVLGVVAAGEPLFAAENIDGYIEIPTSWQGEHFGLVVKGRSMEPRIMDGDVVVVRKQGDVDSGKVAVVIIDGEDATVKRVIKSDAGITLVGNNSQVYTPQFYTVEDVKGLPVQIIGEVIEVRGKP